MQYIFPDYYKEFKCIAGRCRHNCCIGWEIDIDEDTLTFYEGVEGELGKRLKENITLEDTPHFILSENERCPFLNNKNLCDIITELGEEHICGICTDHPRFRNELPGRIEAGLGLCCEEAARIILSKAAPVLFEITGEAECEDEIIILRDRVIELLQNRSDTVIERTEKMLLLCNACLPERSIGEWVQVFLQLERLDDGWGELLLKLRDRCGEIDFCAFDEYMRGREGEYEQLLVYLIYRHFANAPDLKEAGLRSAFAVLIYKMLYCLGALLWSEKGSFTLEEQIELARMFSCEIEYSDENVYMLLDELDI